MQGSLTVIGVLPINALILEKKKNLGSQRGDVSYLRVRSSVAHTWDGGFSEEGAGGRRRGLSLRSPVLCEQHSPPGSREGPEFPTEKSSVVGVEVDGGPQSSPAEMEQEGTQVFAKINKDMRGMETWNFCSLIRVSNLQNRNNVSGASLCFRGFQA